MCTIRRAGAEPRRRCGRVHLLDRRARSGAALERVVLVGQPGAGTPSRAPGARRRRRRRTPASSGSCCGPPGCPCRGRRTRPAWRRASRRARAGRAVRRRGPSESVLDLEQLVVLERVQALQIRVRAVAVELPVAGAEREAAAAVDAAEVRVEAVRILEELPLAASRPTRSAATRDVRRELLGLLGLLGGDDRGARFLRVGTDLFPPLPAAEPTSRRREAQARHSIDSLFF